MPALPTLAWLLLAGAPSYLLQIDADGSAAVASESLREELQARLPDFVVSSRRGTASAGSRVYVLRVRATRAAAAPRRFMEAGHGPTVALLLAGPSGETLFRQGVVVGPTRTATARRIAVLVEGALSRSVAPVEPWHGATGAWRTHITAGVGAQTTRKRSTLAAALNAGIDLPVARRLGVACMVGVGMPRRIASAGVEVTTFEATGTLLGRVGYDVGRMGLNLGAGPNINVSRARVSSLKQVYTTWHGGFRLAAGLRWQSHSSRLRPGMALIWDYLPARPQYLDGEERLRVGSTPWRLALSLTLGYSLGPP